VNLNTIVKQIMGAVRLRGGNAPFYDVDVELIGGKRKLITEATVTVEQLFGKPGFAGAWFALGTFADCAGIGSAGDTVRVQIVAGCPVANYPTVDYTYTIVAGDVAAARPEIAVRDNIVAGLNADANFKISFIAKVVKDNGIVFIESKIRGEMGDRPLVNDFLVTSTGTTVVTPSANNIMRVGTETELVRSLDDPRQGILGISGSLTITPGALSNRLEVDLLNAANNDFTVNGSGTPVIFELLPDATYDLFITQLRLHGRSNGIKFGQFMNINSVLTNGITFDIKSGDEPVDLNPVKSTDDLKSRFASVGGFDLDVQAGGDHLLAALDFGTQTPLVLRKAGTFAVEDRLQLIVNDNLTTVTEMFATVIGFRRLP